MRISLLLACLFATPVLADCPARTDLAGGIRLTDADGGIETFTAGSKNFVSVVYEDGADFTVRYQLLRGIYLVESFELENNVLLPDTRKTYSYPVAPADTPMPVAGGRWDVEVTTLDGGEVQIERQSFEFGQTTKVSIGGCSYEMNPIHGIFHDEGFEEVVNYLPELGFAYLSQHGDTGPDAYTETFAYVRIEAVEQ